jgi:hypothetical protein
MELTKEQIYQSGKEKFVYDIVNEILKKDNLDNTEIKEIYLDDGGSCIQITYSGAVSASTIIAICKAFGDDDVDVYSEGENIMKLVFCNYKYEALED